MVGGEYAKTIKSTKKFKDLLIQDALVVDKKSLISVNENMMLFDALKVINLFINLFYISVISFCLNFVLIFLILFL